MKGDVLRSGSLNTPIPKTGIEDFDQLVKDTEAYKLFRKRVINIGFSFTEISPDEGFRGQFDLLGKAFKVNIAHFTYLDLMHETRHLEQISRANEQGIECHTIRKYLSRVIAGLEYDAYQYELQLLQANGGANEAYLAFVDGQLYNPEWGYYNVSMQKKNCPECYCTIHHQAAHPCFIVRQNYSG